MRPPAFWDGAGCSLPTRRRSSGGANADGPVEVGRLCLVDVYGCRPLRVHQVNQQAHRDASAKPAHDVGQSLHGRLTVGSSRFGLFETGLEWRYGERRPDVTYGHIGLTAG